MSLEQSPVVTRSHGLHVRGVREETREADFVASTDAIDAYDEIVDQTWQLDRYKSNPVVLYAHQSRELPIGVASMCEVLDGELVCRIKFLTADKNPLAEQVWRMVRDKELRAVSVGFVPHTYKWEKRSDREVLVLSDNELHEISVVPIPANPEALAKMKAKAIAEAKQSQEPTKAAAAAEEKAMSDAEKKALEDKLVAREAQVLTHEATIRTLEKDLASTQSSVKALETQNATLVSERDAALARATKAEDGLIVAEVEALVGVKISAGEKDDFVALRKSNPDLFAKFIAQRSDKKLLESVVSTKQPGVLVDAGEPDLFDDARKSA